MIPFTKYHALGNDYIVIDPKDIQAELTPTQVQTICDRHYGIGSDGILFGPLPSQKSQFKLRIINPDGSEAEKSGNGLRIFARYLWDCQHVKHQAFTIETLGGEVHAVVHELGQKVTVDMGQVRYSHDQQGNESIQAETISVLGKTFTGYRASVGNPHFVIPVEDLSADLAHQYGRLIETDPRFSNRTNVQFLKVLSTNQIQIEIWERGAGYTLASGSSSTAAAGIAKALGLCGQDIQVNMPGGRIDIVLDKFNYATMKGAVCRIGSGVIEAEAMSHLVF